MKKIFIIDCYATVEHKLQILRNCIKSVKRLNIDILLVAHCTIPEDIVKSVNYYIYDSDNTFNEMNFYMDHWCVNNFCKFNFFYYPDGSRTSHEWPIIKSIRNGLQFAKMLGYDSFVFTEYDLIFSERDCSKLMQMYEDIEKNDIDYIVFEQNSGAIETILFSGKISPMIEKINSYFPNNLTDYNKRFTYRWPYSLEVFFKEMLNEYPSNGEIKKENMYEFFDRENKNLFRFDSVSAGVAYEKLSNTYHLYVSNTDVVTYDINVIENDKIVKSLKLNSNTIPIVKLPDSSDKKFVVNFFTNEGKLYTSIDVPYTEISREKSRRCAILTFFNA